MLGVYCSYVLYSDFIPKKQGRFCWIQQEFASKRVHNSNVLNWISIPRYKTYFDSERDHASKTR